MSFWRLYYHIVWATHRREPMLDTDTQELIFDFIQNKTHSLDCIFHSIGGIEDHIHLIVSIPPKLAVADFVQRIKGSSSYHINMTQKRAAKFAWQHEYGVLSFGAKQLNDIIEYVQNQQRHHRLNQLFPVLERIDNI